jgi:hypothetical protein
MSNEAFAARIRERYPEGLTGIFAVGGTRTTYILDQNRSSADPGHINDFAAHGEYLQHRYGEFIKMFFGLGGQNMIITASSYRGLHERGEEYAKLIAYEVARLNNDFFQKFYRENNIDPYFVGIDTYLLLPEDSPPHKVAKDLIEFQKNWSYRKGRHKLVWEIASIPLFTFWRLVQSMDTKARNKLEKELAAQTNLDGVYNLFYQRFSRAVYGTDLPPAHFYLGTNKSGDLKWRSPMPIALTGGEYMRMFYTPYPSLFTTSDTLQAILADLAFNKRFHSLKTDYSGRYSSELVQTEFERVVELSTKSETTLGFSRQVEEEHADST